MHKVHPNWIAIQGSPQVTDGVIRYDGKPPRKSRSTKTSKADASPGAADKSPVATLRSDCYFESGDIFFDAKIASPLMRLFVRLGSTGSSWTSAGLGVLHRTYALGEKTVTENRAISFSGVGSSPPVDRWFPFHVRVRGSKLELFVDGVGVVEGNVTINRSQIELVFQGPGIAEVKAFRVEARRPQAFVVMQFTEEYTALFNDVIAPVCDAFGYEVIRGDNVYNNGLVIEDIVQSIRQSSVIVADVTPNNANVYYELGYAHGIGKPTILLSDRNRGKLPFDISGFRLLFYDNTIGGKAAVETALRKHLDAIRGA